MKAVFKVMTALLACMFTLRYLVCQQSGLGNISTELQPICHYTDFSVSSLFQHKLLEGSQVGDYLVEKYSQSIKPLIQTYPNSMLGKVMRHFYRILLRISSFLRLNQVCCTLHSKLGPLLNHLRIVWYYMKPYTDNVKNVLGSPFDSYTGWMENGTFDADSTHTSPIFETDSETEDDEDDEDTENDECADGEAVNDAYELEDVQYDRVNSQLVTAAILQDLSKVIIGSDSYADLEMCEPSSLKMEYEAWIKAIDTKVSRAVTVLDSEIHSMFEAQVLNKTKEVANRLDGINKTVGEQLSFLDSKIKDINCTSKFDPIQNKIKYFDETGQFELETYITKSSITSILKNYKLHLSNVEKSLSHALDSFLTEMAKVAESIRLENVEVYEEWADIMISQWSQRMAYMDIRSLNLKNQYDAEYIDENHSNWHAFLDLKKKVISERKRLIKHDLDMTLILESISKFKTEFQNTRDNIQNIFSQRMNTADTLFRKRELREQLEEDFVRQER
ncbi:YFR039C [Saccharomyces arboricola H-6]|uniref:YFR039C n=1 Tax=Saccharomyces arboricola (strain H-6 / AS 2.3317 / CBS 10644) TaxID=1160507 RepID=J8PP03_SACAR|nr:YFR039C [Saccharomyces arboricola H-6]